MARTRTTTRTGASRLVIAGAALAGLVAVQAGCSNGGEGAVSGAALGALAGFGLGSLSGDAGKGAAAGAIVGGVGGAVLGDQNKRRNDPPRYRYDNDY